jgi:ABC-type glycerol-3-phosphate transport system substrate-binding protein
VRGNVRVRYALATLGVACSMAFAVTACGSDDSSDSASSSGSGSTTADSGGGSDGQATAKAAIEKGKEIPAFSLDAESFDASKASGMTIFNIPVSSAIPYVAAVDK